MENKNIDINIEFNKIGMLLEKEDFQSVDMLCDSLIASGYDISEVYLVKLLAYASKKDLNGLKDVDFPLERCPAYNNVINTADEKTANYVRKCNDASVQRYNNSKQISNVQSVNNKQSILHYDDFDDSDFTNNVTKSINKSPKNKHTKTRKWLFAAIPGCIIAVLLIIILFNNGWSFSNVAYCLSDQHIRCLFMHDFNKANCLHGKTCKICDIEVGKKEDHAWTEATCTSAKKCQICDETEGDPLGHLSTEGICERCGVDFDVVNTIEQQLRKVYELLDDSGDWLASAAYNSDYSFAFTGVADGNFMLARFDLLEASAACEDKPAFANIKANINKAYDELDTSYADSVFELSTKAMRCLECLVPVELEIKDITGN